MFGFIGRLSFSFFSEMMGRRNAGGLLGFGAGVLTIVAGYNYDATIMGVSAFWLLLAVTFFFADGGFAIVGPYAAEVWPSHLRTSGMGSAYGFGGIGKIIGPVGLALIVGSGNYLKPDVPLPQIPTAFVYLGCWFLMAGAVYYFFGIGDQGQIDRADRPRIGRRSRSARDRSLDATGVTLETLIATSADLAGDQAVIARAEAVRAAVAAASNEIESTRRLPPALLEQIARGGFVPPAAAALVERDRDRSPHLLPRHRDHRAGRRLDRVVPQPGRRLRHVGGLSRFAGGACDLRQRPARGSGLGARSEGQGGRVRRRLQGHGRVGVCLRRPPCDLARRPLSDLPGRRLAKARRQRRSAGTHHAGAQPRTSAWTDIWNTVGLRGTASDQFALKDFFVRSDHSITREFDQECRESGPLYRMGSGTCYQVGFAGVACGIARGALDSFVDVARNKVPRGFKSPLRDNAVVQSNLAQAEVNLRAARGFVLQSMADIWKDLSAGAIITVEQRITVRMAATHAIHKAREAVDFAYNAAGATAIFENHPLERRFRDIHTVTQQLQGRLSHFETVGAWMMGADADLTFV